MEVTEIWLEFKEIFIDLVQYGLPIIALMLSILSFRDSRKANKVQDRLNELEEKLKKYELEEKEKERQEANRACIEARIIRISKGKYVMKIWNSGKATAYNVNFRIQEEYKNRVWREKVPYEVLESGKNFDEHVIGYDGCPSKLKVTTTWEDNNGEAHSKEQIVPI